MTLFTRDDVELESVRVTETEHVKWCHSNRESLRRSMGIYKNIINRAFVVGSALEIDQPSERYIATEVSFKILEKPSPIYLQVLSRLPKSTRMERGVAKNGTSEAKSGGA
ncbi:hypothetical protein Syun_023541 [Stephania yunnanensis]|uniref:Uncharacterized protein n=1 Tax=Stephania yunnanensis TaxID=152371 RepID=A0AAP0F952_9MAGN